MILRWCILRRIKTYGTQTRSELYRIFSRHRKEALDKALAYLEEAHYLKSEKVLGPGSKKPTIRYTLTKEIGHADKI